MLFSSGCKKPYRSSDGTMLAEDRHVSAQPLKFGKNEYNLRVLNNLPYHYRCAEQVDLLKERCLTNIDFAVTKLEALPVMYVILYC